MPNPVHELRKKLKREGLTQAALCKQLKVSEANVSLVLKGERSPGPELLEWLGLQKLVRPQRVTYVRKENGHG